MPQLELTRNKALDIKKTEEYYNAICTNIRFSGAHFKTIVLTSVQPNEGKSTTATSLAVSFARSGFKTLLIDADTRNSIMSGTFKANGKIAGLTSYLSGNSELLEVICDTNVENLSVIPTGPFPPNPTTLLQNNNFKELLTNARSWYDYVIIDSPPIGMVIDAAIIAQQCDASIVVTEAGEIKRKFITKAVDQMKQSGAQFLGIILNKVKQTVDNYGSYGHYGDYGNYGKKVK
ncbi:tyrosine-protein kinase [Streptococcus entericus]|uniref:tyrosine-protein kinase n=1 Tax=Streptococcus entericus TaxID=155680 RepID=UPI000363D398|nr:tyrosine-protein kinase [Streptococcus entericus]